MDWATAFHYQRFGPAEQSPDRRSAFERDYDRLIFSAPFRRLQNKTQVFPLPQHVLVHNRLTHSLEVASVGRSLGMLTGDFLAEQPGVKGHETRENFYRNQLKTVIAAACLAHDLGNPAFGHSGETAISQYFRERAAEPSFRNRFADGEWSELCHFEGNANAFRLLTHRFNGRTEGAFRLTYTTLAALMKYPCSAAETQAEAGKHRAKYGYFLDDRPAFEQLCSVVGLSRESGTQQSFYRHPFVYLTEAADDICYHIIDYEDAHRLGIIPLATVKEEFGALLEALQPGQMDRVQANLRSLANDPNETVAYLRAKVINALILGCAKLFRERAGEILGGHYQGALVDELAEALPAWQAIEKRSFDEIYNHPSVVKVELAGFEIMRGLVGELVEAVLTEAPNKKHRKARSLLPRQFRVEEEASDYQKTLSVLDFIAGMTDNYALELYRNLRGISLPGI